ncbi:hypothetical protein NMY22_g1595 [Coprinellus aureogranulatus]|nr:hypothetical protein NMY22_g1595 [Coprinellus aureogranulatus]
METVEITAASSFVVVAIIVAAALVTAYLPHQVELATQGLLAQQDHIAFVLLLQFLVHPLEIHQLRLQQNQVLCIEA